MSRRPLQTPARLPVLRKEDWLPRLEAALARARGQAFAWGAHDCCLFPCDAVLAMTGVDLAAGFRGRYHSLRGALRLLRSRGGMAGLAEEIARSHGIEATASGRARRGDVVLLDAGLEVPGKRLEFGPGGSACLAIVGLAGTQALAVAPEGLFEVPMEFWLRAWRVG